MSMNAKYILDDNSLLQFTIPEHDHWGSLRYKNWMWMMELIDKIKGTLNFGGSPVHKRRQVSLGVMNTLLNELFSL